MITVHSVYFAKLTYQYAKHMSRSKRPDLCIIPSLLPSAFIYIMPLPTALFRWLTLFRFYWQRLRGVPSPFLFNEYEVYCKY